MILKLTQTQLNSDGTHFTITEDNEKIGDISFHYKRSGEFRITLRDDELVISAAPENTDSPYHQHMTDPYAITCNHHPAGVIYESSKLDDALTYFEMVYQGKVYALYVTHFSSRDMAFNLFCEDEQIAQMEIEYKNVKHSPACDFDLYVKDQPNSECIAICEILYYYMKYCFLHNEQLEYKNEQARDYAYSTYHADFIHNL